MKIEVSNYPVTGRSLNYKEETAVVSVRDIGKLLHEDFCVSTNDFYEQAYRDTITLH
jgi:hypothetical protein